MSHNCGKFMLKICYVTFDSKVYDNFAVWSRLCVVQRSRIREIATNYFLSNFDLSLSILSMKLIVLDISKFKLCNLFKFRRDSQKFAMGGGLFEGSGGKAPAAGGTGGVGAEPPALENFAFFCKNNFILGLFWLKNNAFKTWLRNWLCKHD